MSKNTNIIGILGRTNAGKSTLLNNLTGKKRAAVTSTINTTRTPIIGIYKMSTDHSWLLLDSPGVCQVKSVLDRILVQNIIKIIDLSELIWLVISVTDQWGKDHTILSEMLKTYQKPIFLILNKIDLVNKTQIMKKIQQWQQKLSFVEIIPISSKKIINFDKLTQISAKYLTYNTKTTSKNTSINNYLDTATEIFREQIIHHSKQEIPHQTATFIEQYQIRAKKINFWIVVIVASNSQKGIILGRNGNKIFKIRSKSEIILNKLWKKPVTISCQIKVEKKWYQNIHILKKLGVDWDSNKYVK